MGGDEHDLFWSCIKNNVDFQNMPKLNWLRSHVEKSANRIQVLQVIRSSRQILATAYVKTTQESDYKDLSEEEATGEGSVAGIQLGYGHHTRKCCDQEY